MISAPSFHGLELTDSECSFEGMPLKMTGKELQILALLMRHDPEAVTHDGALKHLYGELDQPEVKIIDVFGLKLAKKLEAATNGLISVHVVRMKSIALWYDDGNLPTFPGEMAMRIA